MNDLPRPLSGIIPPLLTPLRDGDTLDPDGLEQLVEHVLAGGVHGLFLLGTTGEGPSLSYALRKELVGLVCRQVAGRVPVLVGITDTARAEALHMADLAAEAGAAAVVLAPPPYFPTGQADLRRYVEELVEELPLPVFLYNMPSHCKVAFALETLRDLVETPRIAGLKDSSGDMTYFHAVRQMTAGRPDFALLVGPEELLAESVLLGGCGGVCGGANLRPELYVALYHAARAGELAEVRRLHADVLRQARSLYRFDQGSAGVIKGLKCALTQLGIGGEVLAPPLHPLSEPQRAELRQALAELPLAVGAASRPSAEVAARRG